MQLGISGIKSREGQRELRAGSEQLDEGALGSAPRTAFIFL